MSWAEVFEIADRQHGAVALRQALEHVSRSAWKRRMAAERWRTPFPATALAPGARWDELGRTSAAVLAAGDAAIATARSALWLHGIAPSPPPYVEIVLPYANRHRDLVGVTTHRSRTLEADDRTTVNGIPTAVVPRAFLDYAMSHRRGLRGLLIDAAKRQPDVLIDIARRASRARGTPGRPYLLRTVADLDPANADSILTHVVWHRLVQDGFHPDPRPVPVLTPDRLLHPDITFSSDHVGIECDGLSFHSERRHLEIDHRKTNSYLVVGWRVLRIDWGRYDDDWRGFRGELAALLGS